MDLGFKAISLPGFQDLSGFLKAEGLLFAENIAVFSCLAT
jgi:hypothetical protein